MTANKPDLNVRLSNECMKKIEMIAHIHYIDRPAEERAAFALHLAQLVESEVAFRLESLALEKQQNWADGEQ